MTMQTIHWGDDRALLTIGIDDEGRARLLGIEPAEVGSFDSALPLVEIITPTRSKQSGPRYDRTDLGLDLRWAGHRESTDAGRAVLEIDLRDPRSPLEVTVQYARVPDTGSFSASVTVQQSGAGETELLFVSSFAFADQQGRAASTRVHLAENEWLAESRWRSGTFAELGGPDVAMAAHAGAAPRGCLAVVGRGTWSTSTHLPMGVLEDEGGRAIAWQVESNGGWRWQLARSAGVDPAGNLTLVSSGPSDEEHNWSVVLREGEEFTTPITTVSVGRGFDAAVAGLTEHRRRSRSTYAGEARMPVIYNDYMNALMADPTTEKLLPLVEAVSKTGAEIFVVDAGWYSDEPSWWGTVGAWTESTTRFRHGLIEVMDAIRAGGMTPGLWLEPEVVGVDSPIAQELPDDAFYQRRGVRIVENGRYQLDYRHPAVTARMDAVIDRVVADYGLGYVKFDYNIDPVAGTDLGGLRPGEGIRAATAAYLDWIDGVHARHPQLIIENCSSGGMRADWMTTSHFALLSTSDQQDALRCVPIAAASTMIVPPEQAGVWSYPQGGMPRGERTVTLANSVTRRPILSGRLDLMDDAELTLVREYITAHKGLREELGTMQSTWPLGLPAWEDAWVAAGLVGAGGGLLTVWRRGGADEVRIPLGRLVEGPAPAVEVVFPADTEAAWRIERNELVLALDAPSAVVLRLKG